MRFDNFKTSQFVAVVMIAIFFSINASCSNQLPDLSRIKNAEEEAQIFRGIASSRAAYQIEFFDSANQKLHFSNANRSVLDSVARIEISLVASNKSQSYRVIDVDNLGLLLNE